MNLAERCGNTVSTFSPRGPLSDQGTSLLWLLPAQEVRALSEGRVA